MENSFYFSKTYRYETLNEEKRPKKVIYVLHGYGQLAKFFIRKFAELPDDYLIVAPEGMHRFYLNGASGKVGASWMTKEARETDIKDNIDWLNALDKEISSKHNFNERILLGFSQGGATAVRWKMNAQNAFDKTIIWASDFPPDMEPRMEDLKGEKENHFVLGSEDEFFNSVQQNKLISLYKSVDFKISTYLGRHNIESSTLLQLLSNKNN